MAAVSAQSWSLGQCWSLEASDVGGKHKAHKSHNSCLPRLLPWFEHGRKRQHQIGRSLGEVHGNDRGRTATSTNAKVKAKTPKTSWSPLLHQTRAGSAGACGSRIPSPCSSHNTSDALYTRIRPMVHRAETITILYSFTTASLTSTWART